MAVLHCWIRGGGKSSFRRKGDEPVAGIISTINMKPDQECLVVCHKADGIGFDVEEKVRSLLTFKHECMVHFLTWGNHHGTNAYAHVPNVILAGTLFYRVSHYEALTRLAAGKHPADGLPGETVSLRSQLASTATLFCRLYVVAPFAVVWGTCAPLVVLTWSPT